MSPVRAQSSGERGGRGGAGPAISPSVLEKNIKSILDEKHAHAHNSHKVVLRAFLQTDTRESEIHDVIGVLKLKVRDTPDHSHASPLHASLQLTTRLALVTRHRCPTVHTRRRLRPHPLLATPTHWHFFDRETAVTPA